MKEKIILSFVLFGVTIFCEISNGIELYSNEAEAKLFAQQSSDKVFEYSDKIINDSISGEFNNYDPRELFVNISVILTDIIEDAKKFDFKNFKDNDLKFFFESIYEDYGEKVIEGEKIYAVYLKLNQIVNAAHSRDIEDYNERDNFLAYIPDIVNIIKTSNDPDELEYLWREWRLTIGKKGDNLDELLEGLRDTAKLKALEFWSHKNNLTEMENLMADVRPLYMELHAFIRKRLQKKYGDSIIKPDGLIPDHLFEQVLYQAWTNDSIIEDIFPHSKLPPVESVMKKRFKAINFYEMADRFYEKLGFEKYPYRIWNNRIKMQEKQVDDEDDDNECKPIVFYNTPNIYLEFCENMNFMDFLEAYAQMGSIYYAKEMTGLPAYFFDTYDLEDAIGKAVILSTSTHHNLKAIGMIVDFNITQEVEMNRLMRKAIQKILSLPIDFVHMKLMADLKSGNVEIAQLNKHYWNLMNKYAGVAQPMNSNNDTLDLPYKFYNDLSEGKMSSQFKMEILSYQIYKKLCELSGKYPKEALHLCDVHGSKEAGNALKKMMQLGTSKPFDKVLGAMFPENPSVMADSLLEYYKPIKTLLVEKNKEAHVKPGWKTSDKN